MANVFLVAIIGGGYVYFSDGIGIVKIRKSDMAPVDWAYTTELGAGSGWAMGLRVVENTQGQEIVIVFNGSSLLVFDSDLNLIDSYNAGEAIMPAPEPLFLSVDKNRAAPNSLLSLRGNGFGANEEIKIKFAGNNYIAQTDQTGFFKTIITVPEVKAPLFRLSLTFSRVILLLSVWRLLGVLNLCARFLG